MAGYVGYQGATGYGDPERAKVDRKRQLAEMLQQGALDTGPKSIWEGAAQLGKAFIARGANERADQAESAYADTVSKRNASLIAALAPDTPAGRGFDPATQDTYETPATPNPNRQILAELLQQGGSVGDVVSMRSALEPKPPRQQFLQGPDGAITLGNLDAGTLTQLQPGTPKPAEAPEVNSFGQMWDGSKYVTVPGALDNYGRMHPQSPGSSTASYRPATPDDLKKWNIPEGVSVKINTMTNEPEVISGARAPSLYTPTEQKTFHGKASALKTLGHLTSQYRTLVDQYGPGLFDSNAKGEKTIEGQKLLAAHNNLMMYLKGPEMFNLGVLTGPDLERLQRTLPEPVGFGAFGQSKDTLNVGLKGITDLVDFQMNQIPDEFRSLPGEAEQSAKPKPSIAQQGIDAIGGVMKGIGGMFTPQGRAQPQPQADDLDSLVNQWLK